VSYGHIFRFIDSDMHFWCGGICFCDKISPLVYYCDNRYKHQGEMARKASKRIYQFSAIDTVTNGKANLSQNV